MLHVALVGASGGIGAAILENLLARDDILHISATYFASPAASSLGNIAAHGGNTELHWTELDARDENQVMQWMAGLGQADWIINCAGMLHDSHHMPEKSIETFSPSYFEKCIAVNTLPTLLLAKHARSVLKSSNRAVFATISAKVGSISDNRLGGWYSYRASKAALNMALKCLSIEWARNARNIKVAALHPGTTDSRLSKPFQKNVPQGKLFPTAKTAAFLVEQIESLHHRESGCFLAYDGEEIPW